ncbi:hypothetical protein FRB99_001453 [Tulasnella sp. 403]|nr:hypothetical protein FRB99_001453 [Tulasnella sp. 403]
MARWSSPYRLLRLALGSSASQELSWIRQAAVEQYPPPQVDDAITEMAKKRASGMPLAYVIGDQPFGTLTIKCRPPTLIPRPETEDWVLRLAKTVSSRKAFSLLDICSGTGCIPLLLAHTCRNTQVRALGVDLSPSAVELALENQAMSLNSGGSVSGKNGSQINFVAGDIFAASFNDMVKRVAGCSAFDVITCNPPYIPRTEYETLTASVKEYEDPAALIGDKDGETDGLSFFRRLVDIVNDQARGPILKPGGVMVVEHGQGQSDDVQTILQEIAQPKRVEAWKDQYDRYRTVAVFTEE